MSRVLRLIPGREWRPYWRLVAAGAHRYLGQTSEAAAEFAAEVPDLGQAECPWWVVNAWTDLLVSAGRYREALNLPRRWTRAARKRGRTRDPDSFATARINQAEALHNLGRDDAALLRLRRVAHLATRSPLAINGLYCLRAWIRLHRGEFDAAREDLARIDERALHRYAAELCYTRAALERDTGNLLAARRLAERGLQSARSASSIRNGQFLLAGLLALAGEVGRSRELFEQAALHTYVGQGGDGLWRFAALLDSMGDHEEANRVRRLIVERDSESFYAAQALEGLASRSSKAQELPNSALQQTKPR